MERILCAAIYIDTGRNYKAQPKNIKSGYVVCGRRHHNCFQTLSLVDTDEKESEHRIIQGFITSDNRFVDRIEAEGIAITAGQVTGRTEGMLMSEDLY